MNTLNILSHKATAVSLGLALFAPICAFADNENYTEQDVSSMDFSQRSMKNSSWMFATAENTNFTGTDLTSANFAFASSLYNANFTNATIRNASFHGANNFTYAQLQSTKSYKDKDLRGVNLSEFNMNAWDFSGQNLSDSQWHGGSTRIENTNFRNANLSNAYFREASIYNSDFRNANLSGAHFQYLWSFNDVDFKNANLSNAHIEYTWDMGNLNFTNANLQNAVISGGASFGYINFSGADLRGANFTELEMSGDAEMLIKNTIMNSGKVKNFSMMTPEDELIIRSGDAMVGIEDDGDYTVEGGAKMIFHEGENSTLLISSGQSIVFNDDALIEFVLDDILSDTVLVMSDTGTITYGKVFSKDNIIIYNSDGTLFDGEYTLITRAGMLGFTIVPEPAEFAALFGALALGFVYLRKKRK